MAQLVSAFFMYESVGSVTTPSKSGEAYMYESVGEVLTGSQAGSAIMYENIGTTLVLQSEPAIAYENIIPKPPYVGWGTSIR